MAIRGAIFDCDGTLLDSMSMWTDCCVELLRRYGVSDAERVFREHESLDMDKKCLWYHENLGIGTSADSLFLELWDHVSHAYRSCVRPYEGCRAFLEDLRRRKVPCLIVSSTPKELLSAALRDHDLLQYFDDVIFVGDVGRDKSHSDCYLAAWRMLGTPRADTWVFEDAPFGVRSAVRVGLPTVAILNERDGRDESFMRRWATYVASSYEQINVHTLARLKPHVLRTLVVAGSPQQSSPKLVARLASEADLVVAADKGVDALMRADVTPHIFCGDEDSANDEALEWAQRLPVRFERHPVEKDDTDLGLAIACARQEAEELGAALDLTLTCASGGRPDHALAVWGVMARHADASPRMVEDGFECRILSPRGSNAWELRDYRGATVSLVALAPHTVATEEGMRWNLKSQHLEMLGDMGVSNRVCEARARICCEEGCLAVFVLDE